MTAEEKKDTEIDIVLWTMQKFPQRSPEHLRIQAVWFEASFSGVLRGDLPQGHEAIRSRWDDMVAECRRMAQ